MTTQQDGLAQPTSHIFTAQGLALHYVDWGNHGAPLLVLLHGMRDHARSWDWTARALRERFHVIALDLRGHGDSAWSPDGAYLAAYQMQDVADLLESFDGQVSLVGHSFGGNLAARYAGLFTERVRKLVLVDGMGPAPATLHDWAERGPVARSREWLEARRKVENRAPRPFATLQQAVERMAAANRRLSAEQVRHLAEHGVRACGDGFLWKFDPRLGAFLPEDFCVDLACFWRAVSAPTLLCWGSESWTSHPESDGRAQQFFDQRTVVFADAGHWLHHDQLESFCQALLTFL